MGTFDAFADASEKLFIEGSDITIQFTRTGNTTGTVSWNIPLPASGCAAKDQVYCGMVVLYDNVRQHVPPNLPKNDVQYKGDPTADRNLHAGDKIGSSLVIGAFYEELKKGLGEPLTTSIDITGLDLNLPVFISGFAVDCQFRYHVEGVHTFSSLIGKPDEPSTQGIQLVGFNQTAVPFDPTIIPFGNGELLSTNIFSGTFFAGILGTDSTGLVYGSEYEFTFYKDKFFANFKNPGTRITVLGQNAQTYDELVIDLNKQFSTLTQAPNSPVAPLTGTYYWNGSELFQWDGNTLNPISVLVELTDPATRVVGDYWFNTDTNDLFQWDGSAWVLQTYFSYHKDPTNLSCGDYWFDGTDAWNWDGTTWCLLQIFNQTIDPSLPVYPDCADYWFDETNSILNKWNNQTFSWDPVFAIFWDIDPNGPITGSFWFDETNQKLFIRNTPAVGWNEEVVTINDTEPPIPFANQNWYAPTTETLSIRNGANDDWIVTPVLVLDADPTDRESCDLWWQSTSDQLRVWDLNTSVWDLVSVFTISGADPAAAPSLTTNTIWYNPVTMKMFRWDGNCWVEVTFIDFPTDPTTPVVGLEWFNTTDSTWFVWNGAAWDLFDPINSATDPNSVAAGDFWYDTTNDSLFQWNGIAWIALLFTTVDPTPKIGATWFDTINEVCNEWDGAQWIIKQNDSYVVLDACGNLLFSSRTTGSDSSFVINQSEPITLFTALEPTPTIVLPIAGGDGVSGLPSYEKLGIGFDGTPDERRELQQSMRAQLGWPIVEVELTKYQMNEAVQIALEDFRLRSSLAYKRGFLFLDMTAGVQRYILTNERIGFHKIVTIMGITRLTSAFLTTAFGSGAYGQVVLQQLYNMGTFDLLSYDLVSQYIEQLEQLFASRMTFHWDEPTRALDIYQTIVQPERVLLDVTIERTENELLLDRWSKNWIEKRSLVSARLMLAEIRGKYGSLPGAGGGVQLNASELISRADQDLVQLYDDIDNFVVQDIEDYGQYTTFTIG